MILLLAGGTIFALKKFAPKPDKETRDEALPIVKVVAISPSSTSVKVPSQGILQAPTETSLAAEVGGTIISVGERFEVGQQFKKGDVLVEIDPADYASALAQMESNVADAKLNLALERGRARQAERDWKSVGNSGKPSELVLRLPQVMSAEAKLVSAEAAVEKARRDLERTKIRAPYDCQIRATYSEVGSFVAPGARIADVFELGGLEVRLPVPLDDFAFIEGAGEGSEVDFFITIAGEEQRWKGEIARDEGVIDRGSRSVYLVATIEPDGDSKFLNPGLFVRASIGGRRLENIFAIPRKALYGTDQVYVIDDEDKLNFRTVTVVRTETDRVLISEGLEEGERVCVTNLAAAIDKMKVRIKSDEDGGAEESTTGGAGGAPEPEA